MKDGQENPRHTHAYKKDAVADDDVMEIPR